MGEYRENPTDVIHPVRTTIGAQHHHGDHREDWATIKAPCPTCLRGEWFSTGI